MPKITGITLIFTTVNTTVLIWFSLIIIIKVIMCISDWVRPSIKIKVSRYSFFFQEIFKVIIK